MMQSDEDWWNAEYGIPANWDPEIVIKMIQSELRYLSDQVGACADILERDNLESKNSPVAGILRANSKWSKHIMTKLDDYLEKRNKD